jgi:mRNA degradation ribonuclease J1/J2
MLLLPRNGELLKLHFQDDRQSVIANPSDWVQRLFQQFTIAEESGRSLVLIAS